MLKMLAPWTTGLLLLALHLPCSATSLKAIPPFDGVEDLSVDIMIGGPLTVEQSHPTGLFHGDSAQATRFVADLKDQLERALVDAGYRISQNREQQLLVSIYGRPERVSPDEEVILYQVSILFPVSNGGDPDFDAYPDRQVIDLARPEEFEDQAKEVVLQLLQQALP
jgi:hypothetical protein